MGSLSSNICCGKPRLSFWTITPCVMPGIKITTIVLCFVTTDTSKKSSNIHKQSPLTYWDLNALSCSNSNMNYMFVWGISRGWLGLMLDAKKIKQHKRICLCLQNIDKLASLRLVKLNDLAREKEGCEQLKKMWIKGGKKNNNPKEKCWVVFMCFGKKQLLFLHINCGLKGFFPHPTMCWGRGGKQGRRGGWLFFSKGFYFIEAFKKKELKGRELLQCFVGARVSSWLLCFT